MSTHSLPTLRRISRERLAALLLSPAVAPTLAIIDVRDADHVGGHISSSTHVPSSSLDYRIPELIRKLADKQVVVFHCALSQQRGPSAALRYLRERESKGLVVTGDDENVGGANAAVVEDVGVEGEKQSARETTILKDAEPSVEQKKGQEQEVYVLDGGFVKWQEMYVAGIRSRVRDPPVFRILDVS